MAVQSHEGVGSGRRGFDMEFEMVDMVWLVIAAGLVLFMQAGFTALESGMVRAKNSTNVAVKNIADLIFAIATFWLVGYALMFGDTAGGWVGTSGFGMSHAEDDPAEMIFFVFQAVFAGTAATIVSGCVSERMKFTGYIVASIVVVLVIYPVYGHWVWGDGWLADLGFMDFAGSTVVHSVGAWVGLAGAIVLGARLGRFNKDGQPQVIQPYNLSVAAIGVLILWMGWIGFNGGSELAATSAVPLIVANTMVAAACGGIAAFLISLVMHGKPRVDKMLVGIIGGLVGVTAGADVVGLLGAAALGFGGGIVVYLTEAMLLYVFRVDDPVAAVPAHGFAGVWGTVMIPFVAPVEALAADGRLAQFGIQLLGAGSAFVWSFGLGLLLFLMLRRFNSLRVSPDDEMRGLNASEHDSDTTWLDAMDTIQLMAREGDLSRRVPVEPSTEMGQVAAAFNTLANTIEEQAVAIKRLSHGELELEIHKRGEHDLLGNSVDRLVSKLREIALAIHGATSTVTEVTGELANAEAVLGEGESAMRASIESLVGPAAEAREQAQRMHEASTQGGEKLRVAIEGMGDNARQLEELGGQMEQLDQTSQEIYAMLTALKRIAEETDLLALNASIEAARAGEVGRGFAVVADNVRELAAQAAESVHMGETLANTIRNRSKEAFGKTQQTAQQARVIADQAREAGGSLQTIMACVSPLADLINTVGELTEKQESIAETTYHARQRTAAGIKRLEQEVDSLKGAVGFFVVDALKPNEPVPGAEAVPASY